MLFKDMWWIERWAEICSCQECVAFKWKLGMLPAKDLVGAVHHPDCSRVPTGAERKAYAIAQRAAGK